MEIIKQLLANSYFVWCAMAVIIFGVTQLLKLPIKAVTKKVKNERKRRIINATILLIPFALGILFEFFYTTYYLHTAFTASAAANGLGYGTAGISLYGIIERFFKVKVNNPYDSQAGQAVLDLVDDVTADGKVDSNDKNAVDEFYEKIGEEQKPTKDGKK